MADPASLAALVAAATSGVASIVTAIRGGETGGRLDALEAKAKALRTELEAQAEQLAELRRVRAPTGSHPVLREPLPSSPDRDLDRRLDALERWRSEVEGALRALPARVESVERSAQRMREKVIAWTSALRAQRGRLPAHVDTEDDRGSGGL